MRLFVSVFGIALMVLIFSINYISATSAVAKSSPLVADPVCKISALDLTDNLSAGAWQVTNLATGEIITQANAKEVFAFASVVKLLTAHVVSKKSDLYTAHTKITYGDVATEGRAGNLQIGEEYLHHELLLPLLMVSSNDAGATYARIYPGLVEEMQNFAKQVGASDTTIADTTGLSDNNRTTASDLSLLVREIYHQSPHIFDITKIPLSISRYEEGWVNNIPFRSLTGYQGGKQGFTYVAKQSGVAVFTVGEERLVEVAVVVLFSDNIAKDMEITHNSLTKNYSCK